MRTHSEEDVRSFDEVPEVVPNLIASKGRGRISDGARWTRPSRAVPTHHLVQSMALRSVVDETGIDLDMTPVDDLDSLVSLSDERDESSDCFVFVRRKSLKGEVSSSELAFVAEKEKRRKEGRTLRIIDDDNSSRRIDGSLRPEGVKVGF